MILQFVARSGARIQTHTPADTERFQTDSGVGFHFVP